MSISVTSWNGNSLNSASYIALLELSDRPFGRTGRQVLSQPPGTWPKHVRVEQQPKNLVLHVFPQAGMVLNTAQRELASWFPIGLEGELVIDEDGTSKSIDAVVTSNVRYADNPAEFTATLVAADPRWRAYGLTTAAATIAASGQSFIASNPGTIVEDAPVIQIRPSTAKAAADGYLYRRRSIMAWRSTRESGYYAFELTNGGMDHAAEVSASRSQTDGDDIRVMVDGIEVPRWLGEHANNDANSTLTTVWANMSWQAVKSATLLAAITTSLPTLDGDLEVVKGGTSGWPQSGALLLDDEVILYAGLTRANANGREAFTGIQRGAWNTTVAAHSASAVMYWCEHEIEIIHGNTGVSAPDSRADLKPMLDLTQATPGSLGNNILPWINFQDDANPGRSMQWKRRTRAQDDQADKILAPGGSPAANLTFEYQSLGAVAGKPVGNTWYIDLPTGTGSSGGNVASLTRTLADTLGMWIYGVDGDGAEVVLQKLAGALSSASLNVTAPANPIYRLECWAFNQVIAKSSPSEPAPPVSTLTINGSNDPYQQFRTGSEPLEMVGFAIGCTDASGGNALTPRVFADNGSNVPLLSQLFGADQSTVIGSPQVLVFPTNLAAGYLDLAPSSLYWLNVSDPGGGTTTTWDINMGAYQGLRYRAASVNDLARHFRFAIYGRPSPLASSFVRCDDQSFADNGDQAVVDGVTVYLSSTGIPYVSLKARESIYRCQGSLYNETTRQSVAIDAVCGLSDTLELDIAQGILTNGNAGDRPIRGLTFSDPDGKFELAPGANTLTWNEPGVVGVDIALSYFGRWE